MANKLYDLRQVTKLDLFGYIEKHYPSFRLTDSVIRSGKEGRTYQNDKGLTVTVYRNVSNEYFYFNKSVSGSTSGTIIDFTRMNENCNLTEAVNIIVGRGYALPEINTVPGRTDTANFTANRDFGDLDKYYRIDLAEFILSVDPRYVKDEIKGTRKNPILRRYENIGGNTVCVSKIIISRNPTTGHYSGYDRNEKTNIINFTQELHGGRHLFNLGKVRGFLDRWSEGNAPAVTPPPHNPEIQNKPKKPFNINDHFIPEINNRYFMMRGISSNILLDKNLRSVIGSQNFSVVNGNKVDLGGAKILNTAYIMRDAQRNPTSLVIKNKDIYDKTFSGIVGDTFRSHGLIYNDFDPEKKSTFLVTEAFDDALSYFQLHPKKFDGSQPVLVASAGELARSQISVLNDLISSCPDVKIITGFDRDVNGARFNCAVVGAVAPTALMERSFLRSYNFSTSQREKGEKGLITFDTLIFPDIKSGKDFIDKTFLQGLPKDFVFELNANAQEFNGKFHFKPEISFQNTFENWNAFSENALSFRFDGKLKDVMEIHYPVSKDFNKDLQDSLGLTSYKENTAKFNSSDKDLKGNPKSEWMITKDRNAVEKALTSKEINSAVAQGKLTSLNAIQIIKKAGFSVPKDIVLLRNKDLKKKGYDVKKTVRQNLNENNKKKQEKNTDKTPKNKGFSM